MKPNLYIKNAFDATKETTFTFTWNGFQSTKNRLVICDNLTNTVVYDATQTTFQLRHVVVADILINGNTYNAEVYVYDVNDVPSTSSNKIIFKTYSTPTWGFSNLTEGQIIKNSSYQLELSYSQSEGELLNSYKVSLYDSSQSLVYETGILYVTDILTANISNLSDNSQYYIRATGKTLNGMDLDTGYIEFSVEYIAPSLYSLVELENVSKDGCIKIASNIVLTEGKSIPSPLPFIDDDLIDLSLENSKVWFDEGFNIERNFTIQIKGVKLKDFSSLLEISNGINKIILKTAKGNFTGQANEKFFLILEVYNSNSDMYMTTSNLIDLPNINDNIHIWIKRIDNIYQLIIEKLI